MSDFHVVICGGGIAGVEGLLRLRRLVGDEVRVTVVTRSDALVYRPLAVEEPFSLPGLRRYPLRRILADTGAEWVEASLSWLDVDGQVVHTDEQGEVPYDALLVAVGGRPHQDLPHATTFGDGHEAYRGIVQDVEQGYTKSLALVLPRGPTWPLPLYELALLTAAQASCMGIDNLELHLVTPEPEPLAAFGRAASEAVGALLQRAGVTVHASSCAQTPAPRRLVVEPEGLELRADRIVALPRILGPAIRGLPGGGAGGFVPVDRHCTVPKTGGRVFAAGDATAFPLKHGGLGAQQADIAAAGIARLAGAELEVPPYRPTIRGMLLTGEDPLFLTARLIGTHPHGFESEVSREARWAPADKVVAEELGPYLTALAVA